eukprot:586315-Hanusia_phi.AAC.1
MSACMPLVLFNSETHLTLPLLPMVWHHSTIVASSSLIAVKADCLASSTVLILPSLLDLTPSLLLFSAPPVYFSPPLLSPSFSSPSR